MLAVLSERESSDEPHRYPFSRVRANQIRRAAEQLCETKCTLRSYLESSRDIRAARRRLALEVSGLGPKQASLFLRNVGYGAHVAVLDVHVLTYMYWAGLTETPIASVATLRRYEALERLCGTRLFIRIHPRSLRPCGMGCGEGCQGGTEDVGIVTLVSGGFDSTLMSLMAQEEGIQLFPLFVDYGQLGLARNGKPAKGCTRNTVFPR